MQRRAAAALFVFFLVMGASAYSVIALAEAPTINLEQEEAYSKGDNFVIDGQRYNVSELGIEQASGGGGGHGGGGGGGASPTGTITWTVQNATFNETLQNGSTIDFANGTYLVTVGVAPNASAVPTTGGGGNTSGNASTGNQTGNTSGGAAGGGNTTSGNTSNASTATANATGNASTTSASAAQTGNQSGNQSGNASGNQSGNATNGSSSGALEPAPGTLVLTEQQDVEAILQADPAVYNTTSTSNGQQFVRYRSNGSFVPLSEYLSTPEQRRFTEGDTLTFKNRTVRVTNVTNTSAVVSWTDTREGEVSLEQGSNVTLANGESYIVNFIEHGHGNNTTVEVQLSQNFEAYERQNQLTKSFHARMNGLWGVIIISGIAAFLVVMLAYMPVRG